MQLTKFRSEDSTAAETNKNLANREIYYLICVIMQLANITGNLLLDMCNYAASKYTIHTRTIQIGHI